MLMSWDYNHYGQCPKDVEIQTTRNGSWTGVANTADRIWNTAKIRPKTRPGQAKIRPGQQKTPKTRMEFWRD